MTDANSLNVDIEMLKGDFLLRAKFSAACGLTAFFGRSGAGKSMLANAIAGLVTPNSGQIILGERTLYNSESNIAVPPEKRRIGYVFQDGRLFPHLTVQKNLDYGRRFIPRGIQSPSFEEIVELLDLKGVLHRYPRNLSGGEKQRVAFGRAVLSTPELLVMDEPLAALDVVHKGEILPFIERLRDEIGIPIIYVSHALEEVVRLADNLVVLDQGSTVASGGVENMMCRLDLRSLTSHHDSGAVMGVVVCGQDKTFGLTELSFSGGRLLVPGLDLPLGTSLRIRICARDVSLSLSKPSGTSILNVLSATVKEIAPSSGPQTEILLDIGVPLIARVTRRSLEVMALRPGKLVFALIKAAAVDRHTLGLVSTGQPYN